ncbi:helix-turn-helix domain-containing protein [Abyssicoccus albus]|uniref:DNA-binding XRE family transcriptional regulator n=1 Tax=Abyssicoccus albus TaxID=1817405 RepID=A0A3N5CEB0_9BACL|nr:helix-turn-helix transcriptional regulator [Abyssicoccus albus]RPF57395.1 DNA-binding XRE family transcriptional regulator [Abyssicoccus albus]
MIGHQIKSLRKKEGMTQTELCEGIISRTYLSLIEKGSVQPSSSVLKRLSERLNTTIDDLEKNIESNHVDSITLERHIAKMLSKVETESDDLDDLMEDFMNQKYEANNELTHHEVSRIHYIYSIYYFNNKIYKDSMKHIILAIKNMKYHTSAVDRIKMYIQKGKLHLVLNEYEEAMNIFYETLFSIERNYITNQNVSEVLYLLGVTSTLLRDYYHSMYYFNKAYTFNVKFDYMHYMHEIIFGRIYVHDIFNKDLNSLVDEFKKYETIKSNLEVKKRLLMILNKDVNISHWLSKDNESHKFYEEVPTFVDYENMLTKNEVNQFELLDKQEKINLLDLFIIERSGLFMI